MNTIIKIALLAAFALGYNVGRTQTATQTPDPPAAPTAPTVTLQKWQDMAPLIDRQSKWINKLRAENETLKSDLSLVIGRYDMLLRYLVVQACASNAKIASINVVLPWVKPFPLGSHECPPEGTRYYIPSYLSAAGPPIPPALTDDFNRADGAPGTNWTGGAISSNKLRVTGLALWTPALPADQYVEARIWASSATIWGYPGLVVRASADSKVQYRLTFSVLDKTWALEYIDAAGGIEKIIGGAVTYVAGAAMRLQVQGQHLTAWYNGKQLGAADDSRIAAGSPGLLGIVGTGQNADFDDAIIGAL